MKRIELVTFDLYDTLIELHPTRWGRLHNVLLRLGISADLPSLQAADLIAEDYFTQENTIQPIRDRTRELREAFRLEYMRRWLRAAGIHLPEDMLMRVRSDYLGEYATPAVESPNSYGYVVFPDVIESLTRLEQAGVKRAVISNADDDVTALCLHLDFARQMDLIVTSALVGFEKPDTRTFRAALDPLTVSPDAALHVGDQPKSDVAGALATGMQAVLLDRYQRHEPAVHSVPVVSGLTELVDFVLANNENAA